VLDKQLMLGRKVFMLSPAHPRTRKRDQCVVWAEKTWDSKTVAHIPFGESEFLLEQLSCRP
ncbi:MAG: hypothetical protein KAI74_05935, partial [Kiritimatiellae bacterium]|nr:hypothetical protein [Kiritimatiellia bacterium]